MLTISGVSAKHGPHNMRRIPFLIAMLSSTFPFAATSVNSADTDDHGLKKGTTLYVWVGDQARVEPDFVAVIDFDESSKTYGKVIRTGSVPASAGNEGHHMQ